MFAARREIQTDVLETFKLLDESGTVAKYYETFFNSMDDKEFEKWADKFFDDKCKENYYVEIEAYNHEPTIDSCERAAEYLDIKLYDYVVLHHNSKEIVTPYPVPVGYVPIKRLQQMVFKKNGGSISAEKRSGTTGQVSWEDKNGKQSDMENTMLTTLGLKHTMKEFGHPRSDNLKSKNEMLTQIKNQGFFKLSDVSLNPHDKVALVTLDTYFLGAGIKTDLLTPNLLLKKTMNNMNADHTSVASKSIRK